MNNMEFPWPDGSWKEGDIDFLDNINLDLQLDELTAGAEFLDNVGFDHPDIPLPIIEPPKLNPIAAPTLSNSANSTTFPPKDPASKMQKGNSDKGKKRGPRPRLFKKHHCQVDACSANLGDLSFYHQRNHICADHLKAECFSVRSVLSRFCQRCGLSHPLTDFDGLRKSCRASLEKHNNRRRQKQMFEPTPLEKLAAQGPLPGLPAAAPGTGKQQQQHQQQHQLAQEFLPLLGQQQHEQVEVPLAAVVQHQQQPQEEQDVKVELTAPSQSFEATYFAAQQQLQLQMQMHMQAALLGKHLNSAATGTAGGGLSAQPQPLPQFLSPNVQSAPSTSGFSQNGAQPMYVVLPGGPNGAPMTFQLPPGSQLLVVPQGGAPSAAPESTVNQE